MSVGSATDWIPGLPESSKEPSVSGWQGDLLEAPRIIEKGPCSSRQRAPSLAEASRKVASGIFMAKNTSKCQELTPRAG